MNANQLLPEGTIFARLALLVQQYQGLKVERHLHGITFDVHDLLPLEQVVFRRELMHVLEQLHEQADEPPKSPQPIWRITLITADEPLIVDLQA